MLFPWPPGGRLRLIYLFMADRQKLRDVWAQAGHLSLPDDALFGVLLLLNLNCFCQYPMAYYMWSYGPATRPVVGVAVPLVSAFATGIAGGVWESKAGVASDFSDSSYQLHRETKGSDNPITSTQFF